MVVIRARAVSPALCEMVAVSDGTRAKRVLERRIGSPTYHLLVGRVKGEPVTMASLQDLGRTSGVGDVLTHVGHRGKGYARAVVHAMVAYHAHVLKNILYVYTDNPTAARIYREAGFVELDTPLEDWMAWREA